MSDIYFPVDKQTTSVTSKQPKTQTSVQHTDAVATDPEQQQKQPPKKQYKNKKSTANKRSRLNADANLNEPAHDSVIRGEERRKLIRRQQSRKVLLNTRSKQDRRKTPGQRKDDVSENKQFGIDIKA